MENYRQKICNSSLQQVPGFSDKRISLNRYIEVIQSSSRMVEKKFLIIIIIQRDKKVCKKNSNPNLPRKIPQRKNNINFIAPHASWSRFIFFIPNGGDHGMIRATQRVWCGRGMGTVPPLFSKCDVVHCGQTYTQLAPAMNSFLCYVATAGCSDGSRLMKTPAAS